MKKVLVINFFPAFYPPSSGGEQRYYYLYKYLSRAYDVTLLSPTHQQARNELVEHTPSFREHRIPKENVHVDLHGRLHNENVGPEVSGLVCGLAAGHEVGFRRAYRQHAKQADIIIHECPHMLDYDEYLGVDGKPRVYNSYNVEFLLATDIFNKVIGDNYATHIYNLERRLIRASSQVYATCADEVQTFKEWYDCPPEKLSIVPNGFEPSKACIPRANLAGLSITRPFVLFMGSIHPPNVEAARFIVHKLAPSLPDVSFVLIGSVCKALREEVPNVTLLGLVDEETKAWLLRECSAALNPMVTGAGTNLKISDYMSHGAPVITTAFGARGLSVVDGEHCYVTSLSECAAVVQHALRNEDKSRAIGNRGKELVSRQYTWEAIAERVAKGLDSIARPEPAKRASKPRVLLVNDFPIDCPKGGGEVRIYHLYRELARQFEVTILCLSGESSRRETVIGPNIRQIAIPKASTHLEVESEVERLSGTSTRDIVCLLYCADNAELTSEFQIRAQMADAVVFCHPYLAPLVSSVPAGRPIIYEALNHETSLKRHLLVNHPLAKELIEAVEASEAEIVRRANHIVCVSEEDGTRFSAMAPGKPVLLLRNGVALPDEPTPEDSAESLEGRCLALFIGSGHPPNIESLQFLISEVAIAVPEVDFAIVGSVCDALDKSSFPNNVIPYGFLDEDQKASLMRKAVIGLNPMFSGSGSNLKLADYCASALAVISTPFGIRGFDVVDGTHVRIAERHQFASAIRSLSRDPEARRRLSESARQYAQKELSWRTLAEKYSVALDNLLHAPTKAAKRSLLAITYRYTDVPQGGAEVYLSELLKQIADLGDFAIDIATIDVKTIDNRLHFSASYGGEEGNRNVPSHIRNLFVFPLDMPQEVEIRNGVVKLFSTWQQESIQQARTFLDRYEESALMGGWHFFEQKRDGDIVRWTSGCCELFCADGTTAIEMDGYSLSKKHVRVSFESQQVWSTQVEGYFKWKLTLPSHEGGVLRMFCETERGPEDPRDLGVQIHKIREIAAGKWKDLPLVEDYETRMRSQDASAWVESLVRIAECRNPETDEIFCRVRGPHSAQLNQFLLQHGREYDAAIIQGVPFSITPAALRCTKEVGLPTVLLPHVHMEDRYYHWRSFNDAFRAADLVLGAPDEVKPLFFDRIGVKSALVPGGGVQPQEFEDLAACKDRFKAVHPYDVPFALVLGRKSGAKNYRTVIAAVEMLRDRGVDLNVVLIGPDEDGVKIDKPFVFNYARQPRDIVIGALASSLALVNMSDSESFGIVILESWMCERPVVANRTCSAFAQLIEHGRDGILCGNVQEVADALALLVADDARAATMGATGRAKALQHFTWTAIGKRINGLLLNQSEKIGHLPVAVSSEATTELLQARAGSVVHSL